VDLPLIITSDTSKNQPKRLDSDNSINPSSLIVRFGPEPVWFVPTETLGMIIVPTTTVFPGKIFCTKCTEEFVIGQMLR
jgi:hypothetical protein